MNQVTKSLSREEIARAEDRQRAVEEAISKPAPTFVGGKGREMVVTLDYPVEYDGVVYDKITIRRPIMREWRAYLRACEEAVKVSGPGADDFVDMAWVSAPAIVVESLDFVDAGRVEAAQDGFFARSTLPPETTEDQQSPQE